MNIFSKSFDVSLTNDELVFLRWHANYQVACSTTACCIKIITLATGAGEIASKYIVGNYHTIGTGNFIFQSVLGGSTLMHGRVWKPP